jgi:nitrate/TMAO reductase-like tetraheme cytochrome c subunit
MLAFDHATVPFSQPQFCASCHEMGKAHASWQQSPHFVNRTGVTVGCIECHLPHKDDRLAHFAARFWAGGKDVGLHLLGRYDAEQARQFVARTLPNERCLRCHANLANQVTSAGSVKIVHTTALKRAAEPAHACRTCHDTLHGPRAAPPERKTYKAASNAYCQVCHINFRQEEFTVVHAKAGIGCRQCHGATEDHAADEEHLAAPDILYAKAKVNASCQTADCHPRPAMEKEIGHRPFFAGTDPDHPSCTDCHGQHFLPKRTRRWDKETRQLIEVSGQPALPDRPKSTDAGMM